MFINDILAFHQVPHNPCLPSVISPPLARKPKTLFFTLPTLSFGPHKLEPLIHTKNICRHDSSRFFDSIQGPHSGEVFIHLFTCEQGADSWRLRSATSTGESFLWSPDVQRIAALLSTQPSPLVTPGYRTSCCL